MKFKKIINFILLSTAIFWCFSCKNTNNNEQLYENNNEDVSNEETSEENINIDEKVDLRHRYIQQYYLFYTNYKCSKNRFNKCDITGTIDGSVFNVTEITIDECDRVVIYFTTDKKEFDFIAACLDWDIVLAILDSYVARNKITSYVINDDYIECSGGIAGKEEEVTNISFYNNGYIKRFKAIMYYESFKINYDLLFENWSS